MKNLSRAIIVLTVIGVVGFAATSFAGWGRGGGGYCGGQGSGWAQRGAGPAGFQGNLSDEEIETRLAALPSFVSNNPSSWLRRYARLVTSASQGAVLV